MVAIFNSDALTETKERLINNQKEIQLMNTMNTMNHSVTEEEREDQHHVDNFKEVNKLRC